MKVSIVQNMIRATIIIIFLSFMVSNCQSGDAQYKYPKNKYERERDELGSVLDAPIFGSGKKKMSDEHYLWQATLDIISFMPITSVDKDGGVVITDWYQSKDQPNERLKFNVIITTNDLNAKIVKVKGYRQVKQGNNWVDAKVNELLLRDLEKKIFDKARDIKLSGI